MQHDPNRRHHHRACQHERKARRSPRRSGRRPADGVPKPELQTSILREQLPSLPAGVRRNLGLYCPHLPEPDQHMYHVQLTVRWIRRSARYAVRHCTTRSECRGIFFLVVKCRAVHILRYGLRRSHVGFRQRVRIVRAHTYRFFGVRCLVRSHCVFVT